MNLKIMNLVFYVRFLLKLCKITCTTAYGQIEHLTKKHNK